MAYVAAGTQPWGAGHSVEVVLVLDGNVITVNRRICKAVRRVCGYGHYATKSGSPLQWS